jgi:hypothetical protein
MSGSGQGGSWTNGVPIVQPIVSNGTINATDYIYQNGTQIANGGTISYTLLGARALFPADTQLPGGQIPQNVAAPGFHIAALAGSLIQNTATSTVHAATLNTTSGLVVTEALTTAPGATYTFTLTDSQITATSPAPLVQMDNGTNTGGAVQLTSVTNAAGSSTFVFTNVGSTAFNGTKVIAFHI